jgi:hypothetical protein
VAEGECGPGIETYVLVGNVSTTPADVKMTLFFEDGAAPIERVSTIAATSRANIVPAVDFAGACPPGERRRFGVLVESLGVGSAQPAGIVVERAMYSDAGGVSWAAGSSALATRVR